jgi:Protein of unknown function (DUF4058)
LPLLDHFHPPTSRRHPWESFQTLWTAEIARTLNRSVLPPELYAAAQIHLGGRVEVDIPTLQRVVEAESANGETNGRVAVATWAPPTTSLIMPTVFPDEFEVQVFRTSGGDTLVGAIEIVSPGNKDRFETRQAFASKCSAYLQQGVGLVIVDVVTERQTNLHNELIRLLREEERFELDEETKLYAVAYRPTRQESGDQVEIWPSRLELGETLPTMALALRGVGTMPIDLDATYQSTREDTRL